MSVFRHISPLGRRSLHMPLLVAVLVAGHMAWSPVRAATFGHSRLVSAAGEPLRITIPVTQLTATEAESLRIVAAPASAWTNAGLTPPVDLATLQTRLGDGYAAGSRVIEVWSDEIFNQPIADVLLDIHTSSGVQRYQVSLLARGGATAVQVPQAQSGTAAAQPSAARSSQPALEQRPILVRRGDTMFALAGRHAVQGVSVYQMMIALQRANPQAFIYDNINLIKAGERLSMPDMAALTAISDREARRLFHEQVVAFNAYRHGSGDHGADDLAVTQPLSPAQGSRLSADSVSNVPESHSAQGDQLRLSSGGTTASGTDTQGEDAAAVTVDQAQAGGVDVRQDAPANGIVNDLAQTVASGVAKPAHAATTDAASSSTAEPAAQSAAATASESTAGSAAATPDSASGSAAATASESTAGSVAATASDSTSSASAAPGSAVIDGSGETASRTSPQDGSHAALNDGAQADDTLATRKAIDDAEQRVSQLEENVKNLNRALQSQGEAAKDLVVDGAIGLRQSLTDVATAVTDATIGDEELIDEPQDAGQTGVQPASGSGVQALPDEPASTMRSITTWVAANLIAVITAALALLVLIIAWVLRRANIAQARTESAVTPEMVKEKLEQINLDLRDPTINDPTSPRP